MTKRDPRERRVQVLRAVVELHLATREPVGSSAVAERLPVKASPATIRNDMAELEDAGYLEQPHTSAGRVPTVRAYRLLVDHMVSVMPLSAPQRAAISEFLDGQPSMEDTLRMAARLLARLTGQIAMVSSPSFTHATLRRFEIVPLSAAVFLLIVISSTGRVEQRTIITADVPSLTDIADLSARINESGQGRPVSRLSGIARDLAQQDPGTSVSRFARAVASALTGLDDSVRSDSLYMAGTAHLTKSTRVSREEISSLLDALEEQVVMMRLLSSVSRLGARTGVGVAIGEGTHLRGLLHSSVVSSAYTASPEADPAHGDTVGGGLSAEPAGEDRPAGDDPKTGTKAGEGHGEKQDPDSAVRDGSESSGGQTGDGTGGSAYVGSIGPTHIDYPSTMAAVKTVADYLSTIIGRQEA